MANENEAGHEAAHEHGAPVPIFLLLVYTAITCFFVYYLYTGLKFGSSSPTGF